MLTRETFKGPWAGLPLRWDTRGGLDDDRFARDIAACAHVGIPGVYTGGTTGEFYGLDFDEFAAVTAVAVDAARSQGLPVMIGCTSTSTRLSARRIELAVDLGADAVQVALPYWMQVAEHEVVPFFAELASIAAPIAFSIYETERSKRIMTLDQHLRVRELADNYLMVKANVGTLGFTEDGCRSLSEFVNVFSNEFNWGILGPAGVVGACSSTVYANPHVVLDAWDALASENFVALRDAAQHMDQFYRFVFRVFEGRGFTDTAYDRLVATATGFLDFGLECCKPYSSPTPDDVLVVRDWLIENFPAMLWETSVGSDQLGVARPNSDRATL